MVEPERTTEDRHAEPYEQKPAEPDSDSFHRANYVPFRLGSALKRIKLL